MLNSVSAQRRDDQQPATTAVVMNVEDKRKDLLSSVQKGVINDIVSELNQSHPSFYYLSTIEIAAEIKKYIHEKGNLSHDTYEQVKMLSRQDIQILLSLHKR